MVVRKKRKRRRGERTYHGSHKKWRGGGSRGGRGKAGMHKHKWSYTLKYEPEHFGKRGFKSIKKREKAINLKELDRIAESLLKEGLAEKEEGRIKINLGKIGYEKLLGFGKINKPLVVVAKSFSKKAVRKLEESGGKVIRV